ncbi:hypothetical protein EDD18DRAFT_1081691 [Armillaria luteobubalina]|uniref:Uncharacterized protein n=1 Tax=Armillaria luteobubalina TaxID=153913 RepID=A0AA39ULR6_9AGAR|nr:hypothetical protein EDD18DRAFT_1081691 [Armillaria luteobubalina]
MVYTDEDDRDVADAWGCKRACMTPTMEATSCEWHPWPDRMACTLNILMHLPCSVFSHEQLDLYLWLLEANKVDNVPSVKSMQALNERLQKMCGIDTMHKKGALSHLYYLNIRQGSWWLHELPNELLTPMLHINNSDYYIHEPAMLRDCSLCVPFRWFMRDGKYYGHCWKLQAMSREGSVVWRVIKTDGVEVSQDKFLKNAPELRQDNRFTQSPSLIVPWTLTNPIKGNAWRERSKGAWVMVFPILLYCDDTSGNMSKKWNKHNSFLFVPAGQTEGIWAWDCVNQEAVLLILSIMAMLGDNPMQSEFACHIGLHGKFFCQACWVKGKDVLDENPVHAPPGGSRSSTVASVGLPGNNSSDEEAGSDQGPMDEEESDNGMVTVAGTTATKKKSGRRKLVESPEVMKVWVQAFVKVSIPCNKSESIQKLKSQFAQAQELYGGTKVKVLHTQTSLKDTLMCLGYFIDRLVGSYKSKTGI